MKKKIKCIICGIKLNEEDVYRNEYCRDCYYDNFITCSYCGEIVHKNNCYYKDEIGYHYCSCECCINDLLVSLKNIKKTKKERRTVMEMKKEKEYKKYIEKLELEMGRILNEIKEAIEKNNKEKINELFNNYLYYDEDNIARFNNWIDIFEILDR